MKRRKIAFFLVLLSAVLVIIGAFYPNFGALLSVAAFSLVLGTGLYWLIFLGLSYYEIGED